MDTSRLGGILLKQIKLSNLKDSDYVCNSDEHSMVISVEELRELLDSDETTLEGWYLAEKRLPDNYCVATQEIDVTKQVYFF